MITATKLRENARDYLRHELVIFMNLGYSTIHSVLCGDFQRNMYVTRPFKASVHFFQIFGAYYQFLRSSEEERAAMDFSTFREGLAMFEKELENRNTTFFGGRFFD